MPRVRKRAYTTPAMVREHKEIYEKTPPKRGLWLTEAIGSDKYSKIITHVSKDGKRITTDNGAQYILNKWYIWVPKDYGRMIMLEGRWYYITTGNDTYWDPHF